MCYRFSKLKESHTPACLKKEQLRLIPQRWTTSEDANNAIVDADFLLICSQDITI